MTTSEKVAYLRGLAEGLGIDSQSREGKLLDSVMDILEDLALDVQDLGGAFDELGEAVDQISDDLSDVEELLYDDEDDDDDDDDDDWDEDEEEDEECGGCCCDTLFYEVTCPACDNTITIDEDVLELGQIECPNGGETLEFVGLEDEGESKEDGEDEDGEKPEKKAKSEEKAKSEKKD